RLLNSKGSSDKEVFYRIFFARFFLFFISTIIFLFSLELIGSFNTNKLITCIIYSYCISSLFNFTFFLQNKSDFKIVALLSIVSKFISFLGIIIFVNKESDLIYYCVFVNLGVFVSNLSGFIYCIFKYKLVLLLPKISQIYSTLLKDIWMFISRSFANLYTGAGILLLGYYSSYEEVGFYSSGQKIISLFITIGLFPLTTILLPVLSRKFNRSFGFGLVFFRKIFPLMLSLSLISTLILVLFSNLIVDIFLGNKFIYVNNLIPILSVGYFSMFWGIVLGGQLILNLGYDKYFVSMQLIVAIISLTLSFIFLKSYGSLGLSCVWSFSELIMTAMQVLFLIKKEIYFFNLKYFRIFKIKLIFSSLFR
uniref:oligosaccharide flippase family protein n=1 Tax=Rosenbergiella epipactidis TaxID=1544694 RepID=UPI001F4F98B9